MPIQNGMPGLAAPDPAFTIIVEPRSSLDVGMVEFVRKSLLGSAARDIEIHWWSCRLRVSPDGRWSLQKNGTSREFRMAGATVGFLQFCESARGFIIQVSSYSTKYFEGPD